MPQPSSSAVNPTDPTQARGGKPAAQDDLGSLILSLQNRVSKIESALSVNSWHPFKYNTGAGTGNWGDYDTTGVWGPAGWLQDASGFIHMHGLVKNLNAVTYLSGINLIIATGLPSPEIFEMGMGVWQDTAGHSGIARVDVTSSGVLQMAGLDFTTSGNDGLYLYMGLIIKPYKAVT